MIAGGFFLLFAVTLARHGRRVEVWGGSEDGWGMRRESLEPWGGLGNARECFEEFWMDWSDLRGYNSFSDLSIYTRLQSSMEEISCRNLS